MSSPEANRVIGDYKLLQLKMETPRVRKWIAEQISVGRKVLVDELRPDAMDQRGQFMADVRAKAAIEHPLIASVFEAGDEECFYAYEYLPGASLEARADAGEPFRPLELTMLLRRIAEIQIMFEKNKQSTSAMNLEHLHVDASGVLRVANLVVSGERSGRESARDMTYLGRALLPLVADGKEGTTRMLTLLAWMRGESDDEGSEALSWQQVIELCERIERQLTGEPTVRMVESPVVESESKAKPIGLMVMTGVLGIAVVILLGRNLSGDKAAKGRVDLPDPIEIPADGVGSDRDLGAFQIMAHEVTIGQYHQFLDTLEALERAGSNPKAFDHSEQPESKPSHEPDDWERLLAAARKGHEWNGTRVTLDTPVVGVDWWDAAAYCAWKKGRLPSEPEWRAAIGMESEKVGSIASAGWGSVDPETADRSAHGVLNLAGSVSEWTRLQVADPVNPLGAKKWLIIGGSYKQDKGHALSREMVDSRDLRRGDLGFRVVFDAP
ncbi:MAG: SUMF1/EgtB/PvdO family nonheme iron enzyme [Akkermansiaceae bacterium]|nr:SUMF1/EgtB/PvdO family nonheme iron enzyme [Akkermansiaceae bacterium]